MQIVNGSVIEDGSIWFRRFIRDCSKISKHIKFKRIKLGFYRIYWRGAYLHEVYKEMGHIGHDVEEADVRFESKKYFEEFEDRAELTRKIKNYKEGYWDAIQHIRIRVNQMQNDKEFYRSARNAYRQMKIK